jgi:hypothetical protein
VIILTLIPVVKAEEKSWYEIDGIRVRPVGNYRGPVVIYMPWKIEKGIDPLYPGIGIPNTPDIAGKAEEKGLFPLALELPETLMTSWSFSGGLFEFEFPTEVKDLGPNFGGDRGSAYRRQSSKIRPSLYNDFFNASDKAFADANPMWALSADVTSSRIFLGYYWGVFIPIGDYHRFFKFGAGLGVYNIDLSFKLNICSRFRYTECIGKKEIDSYSGSKLGIASTAHMTIWERMTKDSIWRFFKISEGVALGSVACSGDSCYEKGFIPAKLKNHSKIVLWMSSLTHEVVSYTYRF